MMMAAALLLASTVAASVSVLMLATLPLRFLNGRGSSAFAEEAYQHLALAAAFSVTHALLRAAYYVLA